MNRAPCRTAAHARYAARIVPAIDARGRQAVTNSQSEECNRHAIKDAELLTERLATKLREPQIVMTFT